MQYLPALNLCTIFFSFNRWTKVKGGTIVRNPVLGFTDGLHIKFSAISN